MSARPGAPGSGVDDLIDLVHARIETLRPKLLDLSRRNPLISTRLGGRTVSYIRVVDELPEVLFYELPRGNALKFAPLPPLEQDPADEHSEEFQIALTEARVTDEEYADLLETLDPADEDFLENQQQAERALRDRVREALGMALRQTTRDLSLAQHARNNHISPSFELPYNDERADDGRHDDELIQTLLLPSELERTANRLITKCRSWQLETGLNVMYGAFGFLEWKDPNSQERSFSPLVVLPVSIERQTRPSGPEFTVTGADEPGEMNQVLRMKLKLELGVEIPTFEGGSVEEYLEAIEESAPRGIEWRVRRYVAFGVFPSSRLAMYHDLDTTRPGFSTNDIVGTLLGGTEANVGATPFSPDYDVDDPEFEEKVPLLVTEADSSQFSTLVDIAGGQNLAVEGPPGTGKSQTIVNAIAAAIANGKKVLFVAEKLAALDVVRARLEHAGLAEFLLPLQATRSSREQVARSINERLSLRNERFPNELATRQAEFREARDSLSEYVALMQTEFGETGMTIHEVLGASLITDDALEGLSWELQAAQLPHVKVLDNRAIERIRVLARDLSSAECALRDHMSDWRGLTLSLVDRFTADDLMRRARETSELYRAANQARARLREVEIADERTHEELHELGQSLESLARDVRKSDVALILNIFCTSDPKRCLADLKTFLDSCDVYRASAAMFSELFEGEPDEALLQSIEKTIEVCERHEIDSVDLNTLARRREKLEQYLAQCEKMNAALREFIGAVPELSKLPITVFSKASRLLGNTQSQTLILRSPGVAQAGAVEQLRSAIVQGKELLERQRRLARIFTIELLPKASAILDVSSTLKNGGFFSFLSSDYRAAKRFWNKIRRTQGFEREAAAEALLALGRWKLEVEKFEANPQWRDLLPDGLIGLEMSFEGYMALVDYLEAVECLFPGLSMRPIQHFMKSAEVDLLRGIPDVAECENVELSFENLGPHINKCKTDLSVLQKVMGELEAPTKRIVNFAGVTPATLPELAQGVRETISRRDGLLKNTEVVDLLGPRYHGLESECPRFETECEVAKKLLDAHDDQSILLNAIQNGSFDRVRGLVAKYLSAYRDASEALQELQHDAGAPAIPEAMELSQVAVVLERAAVDRDGLNNAADFKRAWSALKDEGFEEILADLQKVDALSDNLPEILEAIVRRAAVRELHREHEAVLQRYPGTTLDRLRERLASADKRVLELSQRQLRAQLIEESRPPAGQGVGRKSQYTELALLQNEANKKRGFFPTRDVVTRAGRALQELKPCWMMSPLAISQYLPPDAIKFDLCIIDEASQMTPENSIGAFNSRPVRRWLWEIQTNCHRPTSFAK